MRKYVVAYVHFMDNVLKQEVVEALDESSAIIAKLYNLGWEFDFDELYDVQELKTLAFDGDVLITAMELPDATTS